MVTVNPNGRLHCGSKLDLDGFTSLDAGRLAKVDGKGIGPFITLREKTVFSKGAKAMITWWQGRMSELEQSSARLDQAYSLFKEAKFSM